MHPSGMTKANEAKHDGSWNTLDGLEALEVPMDLGKAFDSHPGSRSHFEAFRRAINRAILDWLGNAKPETTRAKRVSEAATVAAENIRANQWTNKQRKKNG